MLRKKKIISKICKPVHFQCDFLLVNFGDYDILNRLVRKLNILI